MMDCMNTKPMVYPTIYEDQLQYSHGHKVDGEKELFDSVYYAADVYTLTTRHVEGTEMRRLENRMKWVLTGEEQYLKDSEAIGLGTMVKQNQEAAQKKTLGTKRIKNKKSKRSSHLLYHKE